MYSAPNPKKDVQRYKSHHLIRELSGDMESDTDFLVVLLWFA
jgi:hypothetical protein